MAKPDTQPEPEETQQAQPVTTGIDLNNLPSQEHNWVERGAKVSCEGANHPHHSHFLSRRGNLNV